MNKKYNIAILLPTRGRTEALSRSVYSIFDNAKDPKEVQILLGFDKDDQIGLDYFNNTLKQELEEKNINFTAIKFNHLGYINIHRYYNELSTYANANWMFIWNDDAFMTTVGWDSVIKNCDSEFRILKVHTHNEHPYSIFPIVPHTWVDLLGYLAGHHMIDAWISQIGYMIDIIKVVDIKVTHDRHDLTGNNADSTFSNRIILEGKPHDPVDFHHITQTQRRMAECEVLSAYMQSIGLDTSWWQAVKAGTQDPWTKLKDFDINNQMVQFTMKVDPANNRVNYVPESR